MDSNLANPFHPWEVNQGGNISSTHKYHIKVSPKRPDGLWMPRILRWIAGCESGGNIPNGHINWTAQNPNSSASGGLQIEDGTWGKYYGYYKARYAPPKIQLKRAEQLAEPPLYQYTEPWHPSDSCWGAKAASSSSTQKAALTFVRY